MTVWGRRAVGLAAALCATTCLTSIASAQSYQSIPAPPIHQTIDSNGVDLVNASWNVSGGAVAVGPASGGLSYKYLGAGSSASQLFGAISASGSSYAVSIGSRTEIFTASGNSFVPANGQTSTLTGSNGYYTYTGADGSVAQFSPASSLAPFVATTAAISTLTRPSGEVLTYTYLAGTFCGGTGSGGCQQYVPALRPQSIASNRGYQLHFSYASDSLGSGAFVQLTGVMALNTAVDYCSPSADTCTGLSQTYPTISYSNGGQTVTDAASRVTSLSGSYATGNQVTTLTQPSGLALSQTYTGATSFNISNGVGTWTYSWANGTQNVTTVTQGPTTGALTTATTSVPIRTLTATDPNGHTRTVVSNQTTDQVLSDKDGLGNTTTYEYDTAGRLYQVTYPEGNYTQYQYDAGVANGRGNVTQVTQVAKPGSGLANIVTYASYDATCASPVKCNKPNTTTDALGNVTSYTYSTVHGGLLEVVAPAPKSGAIQPTTAYSYSQVTSYTKNSSGGLVGASIWVPTGSATCATSTPNVSVTSTSASVSCSAGASDEVVNSVSYSGNNALPTGTSAGAADGSLTATTQTTYNNLGDPLTVQGPLGASQTATYVYDSIRRVVGVIGPNPGMSGLLPRAVSTTYNADSLPTVIAQGTVTSASSWSSFAALQTETIGYDSIDRKVTDSTAANGATSSLIQYTYDNANRLTCAAVRMNPSVFTSLPASACTLGTQGPNGPDLITYNTYDADNRVTQVTDAYGTALQRNTSTVTYSPNGNTLTAADAKGNLTTFVYDGFDRKTTVYYPTPSNGSVSSTTDYEQLTYDADSRVTVDRRRDGEGVGISYDNLSRKTAVSIPPTSYSYDNLGRLTQATRTDENQTVTNSYDALNRQTGEFFAYGQFSYQYDLAGELTRITWPDGYYAQYVYDSAGDLSQIEENGATSGAGVLAKYAYNNLGERTSVTRGNNVTTSYGYDAAWRLSSLAHTFPNTANNQSLGYSFSAANQIVKRTSTNPTYNWTGSYATTRAYSANGQNQLTTSGSYTLSYGDSRGNLTSDGVNTYSYDVANNLVSFNSSATMGPDPLGRLMQVTDWSGGVAQTSSRWFRYIGSQLLAEYGMVPANNGVLYERYVPGPGTDETVVSYPGTSTSTKYWPLADERGSVVAQTDVNGAVTSTNTYDDYGVPASTNQGRFQYTGQMYIPEAGLYHYKARDYSPTLGRFLQTDPIGYGDGLNWYAYTHNDPINGTDPSGMATTPAVLVWPPEGVLVNNPNSGGGTFILDPPTITPLPPQPYMNPTSCPDGASCFNFDLFNAVSTGSVPSYAPTPPPPNPAGKEAQALQQAAQQAQQNNQHSNSCSKPATLSDGLDAFATYTQRAAGGIAVASLIPQAFGGPIDPVADVFTGAGEALAGVLEVSSLSASAVSGGIQLFQGNPLPAATTAMGAGLGAASGLTGPAAHIANTINGEVGSALTKGPC